MTVSSLLHPHYLRSVESLYVLFLNLCIIDYVVLCFSIDPSMLMVLETETEHVIILSLCLQPYAIFPVYSV
jgi:hypothetical protein